MIEMMRKYIWGILTALGLCSSGAAPIDGTFHNDGGTYGWSANLTGWYYDVYARDGGLAAFTSCPATMKVDLDGLTLGGLRFGGGRACVLTNTSNYAMTFSRGVSEIALLNNTVTMTLPLRGTGANVIEKSGSAALELRSTVSNVSSLDIVGGTLRAVLPDSRLTDANLRLKSGHLVYQPLSAGTLTVPTLTYGPGRGFITPSDSSAAATISISSLVRENGVLQIRPASGLAALGSTEKVLVSPAPKTSNGMLDASVTVFDTANAKGGTYQSFFATYDASKGIVPADDPAAWDAATDQSDKIVKIAAATTVASAKAVHALYVDSSTGTLTLNAPIKVGNGVDPAGVIFNNVGTSKYALTLASSGTGALDFGASPGVLWGASSSYNENTLAVNAPIRSTAGVTFTSGFAPANGQINYRLSQDAAWSAPTVISGARLTLTSPSQLPEGDVYITGYNTRAQGNLRLTTSLTFGPSYRFHLSGAGFHADSWACTVFHIGGGDDVYLRLQGETTVRDLVYFAHDGSGNTVYLDGPVTGEGGIVQNNGVLVLSSPNTFEGPLTANGTVELTGDATFGSGAVSGSGTLKMTSCNNLVVTNRMTMTGKVVISGGHVILDGPISFTQTRITGGATVELGEEVDLGLLTLDGDSCVKAYGTSTVTVDIGSDGADSLQSNSGTFEGVDLRKTGSNVVTVVHGVVTGGKVSIESGAFRLSNSPFFAKEVSYWLDASQEETVTATDGRASKWVSANCNGVTFSQYGAAPYYDTTQNGLKVMRFVNENADARFYTTSEPEQRSVYLVLATEYPSWTTDKKVTLTPWGWHGAGGTSARSEHGLRYQWYSSGYSCLGFATWKRMNGADNFAFTPQGEYQIVALINDAAEHTADHYTTFPVGIGGYATWQVNNNFNGKIAEVIAFSCAHTLEEVKSVENYLARKWGIESEDFDPAAGEFDEKGCLPDVLDTSTELELSGEGVFDLNGVDQTIASLAGHGLVTNSSTRSATLTVAGALDFSGTIAPGVKIVKASAATDATLKGHVHGDLKVSAGALQVAPYRVEPPAGDYAFWLDALTATVTGKNDANAENTIVTNGAGGVTYWYCRNRDSCTMPSFKSRNNAPAYREAGFRSALPSVYFDGLNVGLTANSGCSPQTIAIMYHISDTPTAYNYLLGHNSCGDSGVRLEKTTASANFSYCFNGSQCFSNYGDFLYVNGQRVELNGAEVKLGLPTVCVVFTRGDWHQATSWKNALPVLGSYAWTHGNSFLHIGEVVAYNRVLTDDECARLSSYLMTKWQTGSAPAASGGFGDTTDLELAGAATVDITAFAGTPAVATLAADFAGGTLLGSLGLRSGFFYDVGGESSVLPLAVQGALEIGDGASFTVTNLESLVRKRWPLLKAESSTGSFNGEFFARPGNWILDASAVRWCINSPGFATVVR